MVGIDLGLLLVLAGVGLWVSTAVTQHRRALHAAHTPPGITPGTSAETYFRLCRRMAHELDGLLIQDATLPVLSPEQRTKIQAVLRDWEEA